MKKAFALLIALSMLLCMAACGTENEEIVITEEESVQSIEEAPAEAAEEPAGFQPIELEVEGARIVIQGAEAISDHNGMSALRLYYDFTNTSDGIQDAISAFDLLAEQDGQELDSTYTDVDDAAPEDDNANLEIYPCVTIRCIKEYTYDPEADDIVTFSVFGNYEDEPAGVIEFDISDLPGAPREPLASEEFSGLIATEGMSSELEYEGAVLKIVDAEVVDGSESDDYSRVMRVYFEFTNTGDEEDSCWNMRTFSAYQDGVEIEQASAEERLDSDELFYERIAPGETVTCSRCFGLRSENPVEVIVFVFNGIFEENHIGAMFPVV